MNAKLSEQLRLFVLATALGSAERGMPAELMLQQARLNVSHCITLPELTAELTAQADRGWITRYEPPLGAERWRITAFGRSTAAEMGIG